MKKQRLLMWMLVGVLTISLAGCASTSKKVVLTDEEIAMRIKNAYEAPSGPPGPFVIDIWVNKGVVQIDGEVPNNEAKLLAGEIAQGMDSVKEVKNYIRVQ